jgi:hypothetical protein
VSRGLPPCATATDCEVEAPMLAVSAPCTSTRGRNRTASTRRRRGLDGSSNLAEETEEAWLPCDEQEKRSTKEGHG